MIERVRQRIHDAFFLRSRLGELGAIFQAAKGGGYRILSVADFHDAIVSGKTLPERMLVLRHDVDWDLRTARAIFALERRRGIRGSWYFRLATVDRALMREMADAGHDVSYHFEELADLGVRRGAATPDEMRALAPQARENFCKNLARLREETGLAMRIVASHGEFLNRRLGVTNAVLIDDDVRARMNIAAEVYDDVLQRAVTARISDTGGPAYWKPHDPHRAIGRGEKIIYILLHPSHWSANAMAASWHIASRIAAEIHYQIRIRTR